MYGLKPVPFKADLIRGSFELYQQIALSRQGRKLGDLWHFMSGFQPSVAWAGQTQAFGLGWDVAAPLALNQSQIQAFGLGWDVAARLALNQRPNSGFRPGLGCGCGFGAKPEPVNGRKPVNGLNQSR
jgi:hypothetical protein